MIVEKLINKILNKTTSKIHMNVYNLDLDDFDKLIKNSKLTKKSYMENPIIVNDEPYYTTSFKSADVIINGIYVTLYSVHFKNPNYDKEAAKQHCKEERERRIEIAKNELVYLPNVNCEEDRTHW